MHRPNHERLTDTAALIIGVVIIGGWFILLGVCYVCRFH